MKYIASLLILLFTFSTKTYSQNLLWWWDDSDDIISVVKNYAERVKNEKGIITEMSKFNNQLKQIKNNHYLDSLIFWVSSIGGVKKSNDSVYTLYELRGNDLTATFSNNPLFFIDPTNNAKVIKFTGNSFLSNSGFEVQQPFTLVLTIKLIAPSDNKGIFNSLLNDNYSISTDKKNELTVEVGRKLKASSIDTVKKVILIEFNATDSKIFVDNELVASGKLDLKPLSGILLGKNNKNNPDYLTGYIYNCGIFNCILSESFRSSLFNILK